MVHYPELDLSFLDGGKEAEEEAGEGEPEGVGGSDRGEADQGGDQVPLTEEELTEEPPKVAPTSEDVSGSVPTKIMPAPSQLMESEQPTVAVPSPPVHPQSEVEHV